MKTSVNVDILGVSEWKAFDEHLHAYETFRRRLQTVVNAVASSMQMQIVHEFAEGLSPWPDSLLKKADAIHEAIDNYEQAYQDFLESRDGQDSNSTNELSANPGSTKRSGKNHRSRSRKRTRPRRRKRRRKSASSATPPNGAQG